MSRGGGRGAKKASLLKLQSIQLTIALELDDEGKCEDKKSGADDPSSFAGAFEQLLGDVGRTTSRLYTLLEDW